MMTAFGLHKNMVFDWNTKAFKIERLDTNGQLLLERLTDGAMVLVNKNELLNEYLEGRVHAGESTNENTQIESKVFSRSLQELPEKIIAATERRKWYLTAIHNHGTPTFSQKHLHPIILEAAAVIKDLKPPNASTVYRWYRKFIVNQDTRVLIPRTDLRGSRQKKQSPIINKLFIEVIEQAYKASPQATGVQIYGRLISKINNENKSLLAFEQIQTPSKRTFYRMLGAIDEYEKVKMKAGKSAADKRFKLVLGGTVTTHILERVEIDHTPLDLFLIDEKTKLPLGRPTLTVILDHFSRMLLGYYISFQNPSTAAVMGALRHAILPKKPVNVVLPNLKIEHEWPCYGIPDVMVLDNGLEFHSKDLESVAFDLGIRIQYCPKHEPRFKGSVERYLKTVNYSFASQIPGASYARFHLRGDYDPLKQAILTFGEFIHLFEKWVLDIYSQTLHRGIGVTPWSKWHAGLAIRDVSLPQSIYDLQKRIGKVATRSLRRDGILLQGIRYNNDELGGLLRAYGEGIRVRVLYDSQDLGEIQVWGPDAEEPFTVQALDQAYALGLTELQNELIQQSLKEAGEQSVNREALAKARSDLSGHIDILLESRKLRERRRGGAISGVNNNNPDIKASSIKEKARAISDKVIKPNIKNPSANLLPDILPKFKLYPKARGGDK